MKETEMTEKELRGLVKHILESSLDLNELDILLPKKNTQWKDEAAELRSTLVDLMKNIENDNFEDGVKKIDAAVKLLNTWKSKIEKLL